jgi:hypothetical protein
VDAVRLTPAALPSRQSPEGSRLFMLLPIALPLVRGMAARPTKLSRQICAAIDRRNTVQQHIHQHIDQFIATQVGLHHGRLIDFTNGRCLPLESRSTVH